MISLNLIAVLFALTIVSMAYEYNASTPMPQFVTSRFANFSKPRLVIPMITVYLGYGMAAVPVGVELAINGVLQRSKYLKDFEIQVNFYDDHCHNAFSTKYAMDVFENGKLNLPIIHSLGCAHTAQQVIADAAVNYNYVAISGLDIHNEALHNRKRFRNFFVLGEGIDQVNIALLEFIKRQNWTRVALLGEDREITSYYNVVSMHVN